LSSLAYVRRAAASARFVWLSCALAGFGCAGVKAGQGGSGGSGNRTSGGGGSGASQGSGANGSDVGTIPDGGLPPPADASSCQQMTVKFTATNPTVFILVDRSGSEFDSNNIFDNLRPAVEQVVMQLQSQVRFGLASFVGNHASGACALDYESVPIALNNYTAIKTAYDGWGPISGKADTPMSQAIPMVQTALQADDGSGEKYMMIVSDSDTDFCDDSNPLCPADVVTYQIQQLYAGKPSVQTLVIGLPTSDTAIASGVLQNWANAGVGQAIVTPAGSGAATPLDVYYQCSSIAPWTAAASAAGRAMTSLATYSATAGTATVFTPTGTDTASLVTQLSSALAGVRSCTFDLSTFQIDASKLDEAKVYIVDGSGSEVDINLDQTKTNGWYMTDIKKTGSTMTATQLQLFGSACDLLRQPNTMDIKFDFPCDVVIETN
jgi:hypothetical protein